MKKINECMVLIVDDTETNIDILVDALGDEYDVSVAMDGASALENVANDPPDIILLDIMMPGMDGYEVCRRLKADPASAEIPVIFLTAMTEIENKTRGFETGAVDYITKPFEISEVKARLKTHLSLLLARRELAMQNEVLEEKVKERTKELALTQEVTIESMAALAESRDPETGGHIRRTQHYVLALARKLLGHPKFRHQLDRESVMLMYKSAPLHDIGKVGVADHILLKPGKLTPEEFDEMKKHTTYGYNAISIAEKKLHSNSFLRYAREIASSHHEKWDGTGYPLGLKEEEIPLAGRIMALADVYDALICKRVYKPPFTHIKAVEIIMQGKGTHFDPDIVDAFLEINDDFRQIALENADSDEEREALSHPFK